MKIYYAHHIWKYNTKIEEYEIELIKRYFPNKVILNPNGGLGYTENQFKLGLITESEILDICMKAVKESNILIFSSMNGVIGKGVWEEIKTAESNGIPIYYLHNNALLEYKNCKISLISESNRLYAIVEKTIERI